MGNEDQVKLAEKQIIRILEAELGNDIFHGSLQSFVMNEVIPLSKKRNDLRELPDSVWSKALVDLRENHEIKVKTVYGLDRKKISFEACSYNEHLLEQKAEEELSKHLSSIQEEYQRVNGLFRTLYESREALKSTNLPVYEDQDEEVFSKLLNFYAKDLTGLISNVLGVEMARPSFKISIGDFTGYRGKKRGRHSFGVKSNFRSEPKFYRVPDSNDELENLRNFIENCPTAAKDRKTISVPSRAPEVLSVDLLHESSHMIANEALEQMNGAQKSYDHGGLSLVGKKGINTEKAANEIALFAIEAISRNTKVYEPVRKGFKAYLELTKYDNPAEGYRSQHPIKGTKSSIRNLLS